MNRYFEQMITTASPVELVRLLFQRAISSVREARQHLEKGRIVERGQAINHAYLILAELLISLREDQSPELSARLKSLYLYMQRRLIEANLRQQDAPLAEVLSLLSTLAEAWNGMPDQPAVAQASTPIPIVPAGHRPAGHRRRYSASDETPARIAISA